MTRRNDGSWRVPPGGQLSFDLPAPERDAPPSATELYRNEMLLANLVKDLAGALGQARAAADLKRLRERLLREPPDDVQG